LIRSMNTAERAMQLQQTRIDSLANNLANVNTSGFRQILTRVSELGSSGTVTPGQENSESAPLSKSPRIKGSDDNWVRSSPLVMSHATDIRRGPVSSTGRETDVAIMGEGFFAVETDLGERYTRAGSFTIDSQKRLVTPEGHPVLGEGGPIVLEGESFSIGNNGVVMVDGAPIGGLKIVNFQDPGKLEHQGNSLLKAPENIEPEAVPVADIVVAQGHLEGSNVNAIDTLVAMISAQRAFEVQQKTLTTEDEMLSKTVNKLPQVGG
jgi:flagellar basal-body rod protein FlgF